MPDFELGKYSPEEIQQAWKYHDSGDNLLHARLQTFFASQAVLLVPFVLFITREQSSPIIPMLIASTGLVLCLMFGRSMTSLVQRIEYLKMHYMLHDQIYFEYLTTGETSADREEYLSRRGAGFQLIPLGFPALFFGVWVLLIVSLKFT